MAKGNCAKKNTRVLSFQIFYKKGGSDFSHKKGGLGKIEGVFVVFFKKRGVSFIFILTNPFQFECFVCVCFFCLFAYFY